jgi:hypothetical protein
MNRLMKDLAVDRAQNPDAALLDKWEAEEDEDQEGEDIDIVDRSKWSLIIWLLNGLLTMNLGCCRRRTLARSIH